MDMNESDATHDQVRHEPLHSSGPGHEDEDKCPTEENTKQRSALRGSLI